METVIARLSALGERQFEVEREARGYIEGVLKSHNVFYKTEPFPVFLPDVKRCELEVDGKSIPCASTSFVGGEIRNNHNILSSLIPSQCFLYQPNINFNPVCEVISKSNFYFAPSVAIKRGDVTKVIKARKVLGKVEVIKRRHYCANILVGNIKDPRTVVFSHYDSLENGAIDNASGTAASLYIILKYPSVLESTLFVLSGNEEISYDEPVYWGHGYRRFEERYPDVLRKARKIFVLDSLGHSSAEFMKGPEITRLGFPVKEIDRLHKKVTIVAGSIDDLMKVYHSCNDLPSGVHTKKILSATRKVLAEL